MGLQPFKVGSARSRTCPAHLAGPLMLRALQRGRAAMPTWAQVLVTPPGLLVGKGHESGSGWTGAGGGRPHA